MDLFPSADSTPARGPSLPASSSSRHLKRLSLGQFNSPSPSLGSVSSAHSSRAGSPAPSGPNTPTSLNGSAPRSHAPRHLRLSMSGSSSSLGYTSSPTTATPERGEYSEGAGMLSPTSPTLRPSTLNRSNSAHVVRTQAHSPNLNGNATFDSPSGASSLSRSRSMGHSRRPSSISYASSSNTRPTSIDGPPAVSVDHVSPIPATVRRFEGTASPSLGSVSSLGGVEEGGEEDEEAEKRRVNEERASMAAASQPTLIEANADLLSFIAKKERKCLDLREELKRHEAELATLKKKWESIVAKSVASGSGASAPPPRAVSPTNRFSLSLPRSVSGRSPTPSAHSDTSPRGSPAPMHSMDMSLLASTFDPSAGDDYANGEGVDLHAGLDNAKAWMGSLVGKIADVVTTLEESFEGGQDPTRLDVLAEEDEEEGSPGKAGPAAVGHRRGQGEHQSSASASSIDEKRISRASSASIDSASSFGFSAGPVTPAPRSDSGASDVTTSPTLSRSTAAGPPLSQSARSRASISFTPTSAASESGTPSSHGRSRSVFDLASSVTASGWSSFGKRLSAAANSDTFKNATARATTLVETFESGLVSALGPLEEQLPPIQGGSSPEGASGSGARARTSPNPNGGSSPNAGLGLGMSAGPGAGFAGWIRSATGSPEMSRDPEKTPRPEDSFGAGGEAAEASVAGNKLGGYRRPSGSGVAASAGGKSPATKAQAIQAREEKESDEVGESWGAW